MVRVGFEPTPPKRLELESSALDRSATEPVNVVHDMCNSAFVAQLAARGSHNPKVAGSIPVESRFIPVSLGGQDTRLSPESPGFNSRTGNFFFGNNMFHCSANTFYLPCFPKR